MKVINRILLKLPIKKKIRKIKLKWLNFFLRLVILQNCSKVSNMTLISFKRFNFILLFLKISKGF